MHKININPEELNSENLQKTNNDFQVAVDENSHTVDNQPSLHSMEKPKMKSASQKVMLVALLLAVTAGVATGFGTHRLVGNSGKNQSTEVKQAVKGQISEGDVFGSQDLSTFKDTTQGYLEAGGIDGEGSHKLLKPGGASQTVYLTSSVIDLTKFEGMEVKVWGETFKGQQAGWLMDVGRVEVVSTQAKPPVE